MMERQSEHHPQGEIFVELVLTASALRSLMSDRASVRRPVGLSRLRSRTQWLANSRLSHEGCLLPEAEIRFASDQHSFHTIRKQLRSGFSDSKMTMVVGYQRAMGLITAFTACEGAQREIDSIRIIAPGLAKIDLSSRHTTSVSSETQPSSQYWSGTVGALGEEPWRRLTTLNCMIVGCGRTGSQLAMALLKLGVQSITLVDPDVLENHNLGEMSCVSVADLGRSKAQAIADRLNATTILDDKRTSVVQPVSCGIMSLQSLVALKRSDFVFCCVDNPNARLAATFLSASYLKPLIDIGTRVPSAIGSDRGPKGLDLRLTIPGEACLACLGGLPQMDANFSPSIDESIDSQFGIPRTAENRASLASINGIAVNLALKLFEDFVCGHVPASRWLQIDFSNDGIPSILQEDGLGAIGCPVCEMAGSGDAAPQHFARTVEDVSYWQFRLRAS